MASLAYAYANTDRCYFEARAAAQRRELGRLDAVLNAPRQNRIVRVAALRLLLLTNCRRQELLELRRCEVRGGGLLAADCKTGPRTAWLGEEARAVIHVLPGQRDNNTVFYDPKVGGPISLDWIWRAARALAGFGSIRFHDPRHSFASHAAARAQTLPMIERLLGHVKIASTARSARLDDSHLADAAEGVGSSIEMMTGLLPEMPDPERRSRT